MIIYSHLTKERSILVETPREYENNESVRMHIVSGRSRIFEIFPEELEALVDDELVELDSGNDDPELNYRTKVYMLTEAGRTRFEEIAKQKKAKKH